MLTWTAVGDPPHPPPLLPLDAPDLQPLCKQVNVVSIYSQHHWDRLFCRMPLHLPVHCTIMDGLQYHESTYLLGSSVKLQVDRDSVQGSEGALQGQQRGREGEAGGRPRSGKPSPKAESLQHRSHRY